MQFRKDVMGQRPQGNRRRAHGGASMLVLAGTLAFVFSNCISMASASDGVNGGVTYLRNRVFRIPITIQEKQRLKIKELRLFVSKNRGESWSLQATVPPTNEDFTFRAETDGEYWFTLVHVDHQGNEKPANVKEAPPGLKVVIDSASPKITLEPVDRRGGRAGVAWKINDYKVDLASMKLEARRQGDGEWREIGVPKMVEGEGKWMAADDEAYDVRVTVRDRAGNVGTQALKLDAVLGASGQSFATRSPSTLPAQHVLTEDLPSREVIAAKVTQDRQPEPVGSNFPPQLQPVTRPAIPATRTSQTSFDRSRPDLPRFEPPAASQRESPAVADLPLMANRIPVASTGEQVRQTSAVKKPPEEPAKKEPPLIGSKSFSINYQIKGLGPAGVDKVELYYTSDFGKHWQFYGKDDDNEPPFRVVVPDDGKYGFKVLVTSRAGHGQRAPRDGEAPKVVVEVDTTPPEAELYQPIPDTSADDDSLVISWAARDKNLGLRPINIYFAEDKNGPWYTVKEELPASGEYRWRIPAQVAEVTYKAFLMLQATDLGGNASVAVTPEPIVIDFSQPKAEVTGFSIDGAIQR